MSVSDSTLVALITGASSGIGEGITRLLISRGWKVIMIASEYPNNKKTQIIGFDLSNTHKVKHILIPLIKKTNNKIDLLVNNAGGGRGLSSGGVNDITLESWYQYIDVNLAVPFILSEYLLDLLKSSTYPASIINIGSIWRNRAVPKYMAYNTCA